jgi:hypothetical protein
LPLCSFRLSAFQRCIAPLFGIVTFMQVHSAAAFSFTATKNYNTYFAWLSMDKRNFLILLSYFFNISSLKESPKASTYPEG